MQQVCTPTRSGVRTPLSPQPQMCNAQLLTSPNGKSHTRRNGKSSSKFASPLMQTPSKQDTLNSRGLMYSPTITDTRTTNKKERRSQSNHKKNRHLAQHILSPNTSSIKIYNDKELKEDTTLSKVNLSAKSPEFIPESALAVKYLDHHEESPELTRQRREFQIRGNAKNSSNVLSTLERYASPGTQHTSGVIAHSTPGGTIHVEGTKHINQTLHTALLSNGAISSTTPNSKYSLVPSDNVTAAPLFTQQNKENVDSSTQDVSFSYSQWDNIMQRFNAVFKQFNQEDFQSHVDDQSTISTPILKLQSIASHFESILWKSQEQVSKSASDARNASQDELTRVYARCEEQAARIEQLNKEVNTLNQQNEVYTSQIDDSIQRESNLQHKVRECFEYIHKLEDYMYQHGLRNVAQELRGAFTLTDVNPGDSATAKLALELPNVQLSSPNDTQTKYQGNEVIGAEKSDVEIAETDHKLLMKQSPRNGEETKQKDSQSVSTYVTPSQPIKSSLNGDTTTEFAAITSGFTKLKNKLRSARRQLRGEETQSNMNNTTPGMLPKVPNSSRKAQNLVREQLTAAQCTMHALFEQLTTACKERDWLEDRVKDVSAAEHIARVSAQDARATQTELRSRLACTIKELRSIAVERDEGWKKVAQVLGEGQKLMLRLQVATKERAALYEKLCACATSIRSLQQVIQQTLPGFEQKEQENTINGLTEFFVQQNKNPDCLAMVSQVVSVMENIRDGLLSASHQDQGVSEAWTEEYRVAKEGLIAISEATARQRTHAAEQECEDLRHQLQNTQNALENATQKVSTLLQQHEQDHQLLEEAFTRAFDAEYELSALQHEMDMLQQEKQQFSIVPRNTNVSLPSTRLYLENQTINMNAFDFAKIPNDGLVNSFTYQVLSRTSSSCDVSSQSMQSKQQTTFSHSKQAELIFPVNQQVLTSQLGQQETLHPASIQWWTAGHPEQIDTVMGQFLSNSEQNISNMLDSPCSKKSIMSTPTMSISNKNVVNTNENNQSVLFNASNPSHQLNTTVDQSNTPLDQSDTPLDRSDTTNEFQETESDSLFASEQSTLESELSFYENVCDSMIESTSELEGSIVCNSCDSDNKNTNQTDQSNLSTAKQQNDLYKARARTSWLCRQWLAAAAAVTNLSKEQSYFHSPFHPRHHRNSIPTNKTYAVYYDDASKMGVLRTIQDLGKQVVYSATGTPKSINPNESLSSHIPLSDLYSHMPLSDVSFKKNPTACCERHLPAFSPPPSVQARLAAGLRAASLTKHQGVGEEYTLSKSPQSTDSLGHTTYTNKRTPDTCISKLYADAERHRLLSY